MIRPRPVLSRLAAMGLSVGLVAVLVVATASALDDVKPAPDCHGVLVEDGKADGTDPSGAGRTSDSLEIQRTFFKFDAAKGPEAATLNMQVKNLTATPPSGATGQQWNFRWLSRDGTTRFVRAVADFGGGTAFEYGSVDESLPVALYIPEADIPGKLFEGPDGVVQLVVPPGAEPPGSIIKSIVAQTGLAFQVVPSAVQTPTRGLFYYYDDTVGRTLLLAECTPEQLAGPGTQILVGQPLPVKLLTTSAAAKKLKKAKSVSLKLRASEKVTKLAGQLRKSKTLYGKGSLKQLSGTGTLKLKLSKKLKKGSYTLDLVGNDAAGSRRLTAARFKVK